MNWLGVRGRVLLAGLVAALVGALAVAWCERRGVFAPWIAGALAGLAVAALSSDRSALRGVLVGALGAWGGALGVAVARGGAGWLSALASLHTTLDARTLAAHVAGVIVAFALGCVSFARDAKARLPGA